MGKNESNVQILDNLENKIIILGGNVDLFLDSAIEAEGGSSVLKELLFQNSLKLKKNATYMTFWELEIQKKNSSYFHKSIDQETSTKKIRLYFCFKYLAGIN